MYRCAKCGELYRRVDGVKLCPACLANAALPATESSEDWNRYLAMNGNSVSRGQFIGDRAIVYAPISPLSGQGNPLENIPDSFDLESAVENQQLRDFFLSGSAREVARTLGLHHEQVQRLRAEYLDVDRAEVETARKVLGYTEGEWQKRKLGVALVKARAECEPKWLAA